MLRRIVITLPATFLLAAPAGAGTIVVRLTFVPGKLAVKTGPALVSGTRRVPLTIADGRGSGAGWTLRSISKRPVTVLGITARCARRSTCTLPTAAGAPSGAVVLRAARGTGMGVMHLVVTLAAPRPTRLSFGVS